MIDQLILAGLHIVGALVILGGAVWCCLELWWKIYRVCKGIAFLNRGVALETARVRRAQAEKAQAETQEPS